MKRCKKKPFITTSLVYSVFFLLFRCLFSAENFSVLFLPSFLVYLCSLRLRPLKKFPTWVTRGRGGGLRESVRCVMDSRPDPETRRRPVDERVSTPILLKWRVTVVCLRGRPVSSETFRSVRVSRSGNFRGVVVLVNKPPVRLESYSLWCEIGSPTVWDISDLSFVKSKTSGKSEILSLSWEEITFLSVSFIRLLTDTRLLICVTLDLNILKVHNTLIRKLKKK